MSKKPCNLSLDTRVLEFAEAIMALRGQSNLTQFVEELIRDEYERRAGPLVLSEPRAEYRVNPPPPATPPAPAPAAAAGKQKPVAKRAGRLDIQEV